MNSNYYWASCKLHYRSYMRSGYSTKLFTTLKDIKRYLAKYPVICWFTDNRYDKTVIIYKVRKVWIAYTKLRKGYYESKNKNRRTT